MFPQLERTRPLPFSKRAVALLIVAAFACLVLVSVWPAVPTTAQTKSAARQAEQQAVPRPVVGAKCQQCHKEIVQSFALDVHGKSAKFLTDSRATSCESCHGDGAKHIESLEAKDIINPPRLTTAQANESCLQCHARDQKRDAWRGGPHDRKDMSCLSCHSAHHYKSPETMLTKGAVEETCLGCHKDKQKSLFQRSTHLFRNEYGVMKVGCVSCHHPHGGEGRKMLQPHTTNSQC